jgi:hypothetical protein
LRNLADAIYPYTLALRHSWENETFLLFIPIWPVNRLQASFSHHGQPFSRLNTRYLVVWDTHIKHTFCKHTTPPLCAFVIALSMHINVVVSHFNKIATSSTTRCDERFRTPPSLGCSAIDTISSPDESPCLPYARQHHWACR